MLASPTQNPLLSSALSGATWSTDDRSNITAASDGAVVQVSFDPTFSTYVVQTLPDGKYLSYSGLRAASVAVGEQIKAGDVIGTATILLHVTISDSVSGWKGEGNLVDPADYFNVPVFVPAADTPDPMAASEEAAPVTPVAPVVEAAPTEVAPVVAPEPVPAETAPAEPTPVPVTTTLAPSTSYTLTPTTSTSGMIDGAGSVWIKPVTPEPAPVSVAAVVADIPKPVLTESYPAPADVHPVDQIVADALATPKSAAAPIAHQAKGAPMKGGLTNLISLPFWNDTLTRAFNTFLQVGLTSIGAGAAHLFTVSDLTSLKIAGGAAAISLIQSLIRATSQPAAK